MANTTRTPRTSRTTAVRSGRRSAATGAASGRFGRSAASGASSRRFGRGTPTPQRRSVPTPGLRRRKAQKPSGLKGALSSVTSALPGMGSGSSSSGRGGKAGGFALLTAAAGLAFKNRDKLTSMARRDKTGWDVSGRPEADAQPVATTPPADEATPPPAKP